MDKETDAARGRATRHGAGAERGRHVTVAAEHLSQPRRPAAAPGNPGSVTTLGI